jgi:hypothetical protein
LETDSEKLSRAWVLSSLSLRVDPQPVPAKAMVATAAAQRNLRTEKVNIDAP